MSKTKNESPKPKEEQKEVGKGNLQEVKTNEDFNKIKPKPEDPLLKVKKVKK